MTPTMNAVDVTKVVNLLEAANTKKKLIADLQSEVDSLEKSARDSCLHLQYYVRVQALEDDFGRADGQIKTATCTLCGKRWEL